jgi:hypothetical protein
MTRILDGFLTGLTGLVIVGQSIAVYLVRRVVFDRFDRFDRFFSHTHMKVHQSGVQSKNGLEPVKPVKTCQIGGMA